MNTKAPPRDQWLALLEQEEGELLVFSVVDDILHKTQAVIFEKHIERQVLPFAVSYAKDALITMIEVCYYSYFFLFLSLLLSFILSKTNRSWLQWHYFRRDSGHVDSSSWVPDKGTRTPLSSKPQILTSKQI